MGVKVNESGTIKNLALDKDEVETLRVRIEIPAIRYTSKTATFTPSDLGITRGFNVGYSDNAGISTTTRHPHGIYGYYDDASWDNIPSEYKVLLRTGQFNFSLKCPCKFKIYTSSASALQLDNPTHFPKGESEYYRNGISAYTTARNAGKTISCTKWDYTGEISFVLTILDERNYKIEAALTYSSYAISESSALTAAYGVEIANVTSSFPYTIYLIVGDYLIEKSPYSEGSYKPDPAYTT